MNNLEQAVQRLQAGDILSAQQFLDSHLKQSPKDFNALQLLGLVRVRQGDLVTARELMQKSLAIHDKQPHVLNNLASCERQLGNSSAALNLFRQAIILKPDYLDPHLGLFNVALELGELGIAENFLELALTRWPTEPRLQECQARIAREEERYEEAITIYQSLIKQRPGSATLRHNLAITLRLSGKARDALAIYHQLIKEGLEGYEVFHNAANAHSDCAEYNEAIALYREALRLNARYLPSHKNLNDLLWETGKRRDFLASYLSALKHFPNEGSLHFAYVDALICVSRFDDAITHLAHLREKNQRLAEEPEYLSLYGRALTGLGDVQGAASAQQPIARHPASTPEQLTTFAQTLIAAGQISEASKVLEALLESRPDDQTALAYLGTCWRLTGNGKYHRLNNYQEMVREFFLEPPAGYASIELFCADLEAYLRTLHGGTHEPIDQTLVNGSQTRGNLFNDPSLLIQHVQEQANSRISEYVEATRPLLKRSIGFRDAKEWLFSGSWSVILREQGYHASHIHPMGWVSAVFYVSLPELESLGNHQGWLKLGEPNLSTTIDGRLAAERHVKPQVGKLVIFPSYMWHGTEPYEQEARRVTIAFDARRVR